MDTSKIFQKLIIFAVLLLPLIILYALFYPAPNFVNEFNDQYYGTWMNNEGLWPLAIILILIVLLHMFSFYMLYKFKKNGKRIFVITLAIIVLTDLFAGPYAASSFEIFTSTIAWLIEGAMLAMLYVTPVSKKFNKFP